MTRIETTAQLTPADGAGVEDLIARIRAETGTQPVDEARLADAIAGRSRFTALLARTETGDGVVGYAQVSPGNAAWTVDVAAGDFPIRAQLLARAVEIISELGGGNVQYWVHDPSSIDDTIAADVGLTRGRELLQMQVPLPLEETTDLTTRSFIPGRDEAAWLEVNNAAFAWHPEQGGWTVDDIVAREAEPWFDPEGFLLHEQDGRLAGFCWTKVHEAASAQEATLGEIYVIAAHPDFHGRGLGRALTVAGLTHLAKHAPIGMLYVDADNTAAVRLYERLGFHTHHVSRAYDGSVAGPDEAGVGS